MPKKPPKPKGDVDEEVIHLGAGAITQLTEPKTPRRVKKKNPIGFLPWPKK